MTRNFFFIINPASVKGKPQVEKTIRLFFSNRTDRIMINYWRKKNQIPQLIKKAEKEGFNTIVACGGDGTILQIGKVIMHNNMTLGILPLGSGNGIARHFNIPNKLQKALQTLVSGSSEKMDVGQIGEHYFFSNTGFGIEVDFIKAYQKKRIHGIRGYTRAFFKALSQFRYRELTLTCDNKKMLISPFVLMIANTNQQGYGLSLTPNAKTNDGFLNLIGIPEQSRFGLLSIMLKTVFFGLPTLNRKNIQMTGKQFEISTKQPPFNFQIDGEYYSVAQKKLSISILPKALNIITS